MCDRIEKENKPVLPASRADQPCKRHRTNLTGFQKQQLEKTFSQHKYPDYAALEELSRAISMPYKKVLVWFKNRRAKDKRVRKVDYGPYDFARTPATSGVGCSFQQYPSQGYLPQLYSPAQQQYHLHYQQRHQSAAAPHQLMSEPTYFPRNYSTAGTESPPTPDFPPASLFLPPLAAESGDACPSQRRRYINDFISANNSCTPMMQSRMG